MSLPTPSYTEVCEDRDFVEWHRGCPWCAVWLIRLEQAQVIAQVAQARASVQQWLLPRYARQPHVTLGYRGLMAAAEGAHAAAEFGVAQLRADIQALQAAQLQPFALQVQGVGSFATVPYLAVAPTTALLAAHAALLAHGPYPGWRYVPHVTLGHYGSRLPLQTVLQQLQCSVPAAWNWQAPVTQLWLARYCTHDIAGALSFEGYFDLRTQTYHALAGACIGPAALNQS